jgi:hypothetical protein
MTAMPFEQLEIVYERLAHAIDRAGRENEELFLTKLVLLLAQRHADAAVVAESIEAALRDLPDQSE